MNRAPRNPDLPILDELRAQMRQRIIADEVAVTKAPVTVLPSPQSRRSSHPPEGRARGRAVRRITRRSVVIVALLCLLAGVAVAAQLSLRGGADARTTPPQLLGTAAGAQLFGYRDEGRLCLRVESAARGVSACGVAPAASGLSAISERLRGRRFVVGFTEADVRRVSLRVGRRDEVVPALAPREGEAARAAGVPAGMRWFVAALGAAADAPARLVGLDDRGKHAGPPLLDCSLAVTGTACRRAYERQAVRRLR